MNPPPFFLAAAPLCTLCEKVLFLCTVSLKLPLRTPALSRLASCIAHEQATPTDWDKLIRGLIEFLQLIEPNRRFDLGRPCLICSDRRRGQPTFQPPPPLIVSWWTVLVKVRSADGLLLERRAHLLAPTASNNTPHVWRQDDPLTEIFSSLPRAPPQFCHVGRNKISICFSSGLDRY